MRNILSKCFGVFSDPKHTNIPSSIDQQPCLRFSFAQLKKSTNNFDKSQIIGEVRGNTLYKGCIIINGEDKEIAIERNEQMNHYQKKEWQNNIETLSQLRHANLIFLVGFCDDENEMILVYEFFSNGSLNDHLYRADKYKHMPPLSWKKRLEVSIGIARGLHYLHMGTRLCVVHCDVKPVNILLDENWLPKLADLGISVRQPISTSGHVNPIEVDVVKGTLGYIAPERMMHMIVSDKTDVFSFGMLLLELVSAKKPYMIMEMMQKEMTMNEDKDVDEGDDEGYHKESEGNTKYNLAKYVYNFVQKGRADEIIDPFLRGKIAPECWEIFIDIAGRCMLEAAAERPRMNEVELELEHALRLQKDADLINLSNKSDYSLICMDYKK